MLNPIFSIDLVPAPSQGFLRDPLKYRFIVDKTKSKMYRFFEKEMPPDEFYCWKVLENTGIYMILGHVFDMKGSGNNFYYR